MESINPTLVGREHERQVLSGFVTATEGRALALRGDPGVGRSALLDDAAGLAAAENHRVVRAFGVAAERELPFAGLHQLLHPLGAEIDRLDDSRRAALDVVFGRIGAAPPSVLTLGIAVLDLLSLAASRRPLLLVVDDGQWLDSPSAEVCGFVGRRLAGSPVKLLIGLRSDAPSGFDTAALPTLPVGTLARRAAERLLDLRHPGLDPRIRRLVLDEAQGNPLALVELPPHLLRTPQPPPAHLGVPLPRRLQLAYGERVEALSPAARTELLRAALDDLGAGAVPGAGRPRYRMTDAEQAAEIGLSDIDPVSGGFTFRHPLVRSAVVQLATCAERRSAHAVLARHHREDPVRRALHLAAATARPDEGVAAALEAAADSATRHGGAVAAAAWLNRAAELSESPRERSRRLGDAAFLACQAGLPGRARQLAGSEGSFEKDEPPVAALASAYGALHQDGDVRSARRLVLAAIEATRAGDEPETLPRLVDLLLTIDQYAADPAARERSRELLDSLGDLVSPAARIHHDARGEGTRERVERALADLPTALPWDVSRLAVAAHRVDALGPFRPQLQRVVDREVESGALVSGLTVLNLVMLDQLAAGQWDEAERTGQRALDLATAHRLPLFAHHALGHLGLLAALRGEADRAREIRAAVDAWSRPRGVGLLTQLAAAVDTAAALAEGDFETAYLHAAGGTPPGSFAPCAHQASRTLLDLVVTALNTGRCEQARRHALAAHEAGLPHVSPRLALVTYGALAMTATDPAEAEEWHRRAEDHPAAAASPFELARLRLAHGIRLRHTKGGKAARPALTSAAEAFERLGATPWAARARAELPSIDAALASAPTQIAPLTWQERRIADLAAGGLTNKEIGARMRLSPRTVSSHLYRVFPKLGITSRAALRDALGRMAGAPEA
ncbi:LuxR family transcriptional regulator [Kitasatospora brasiliensis]|uniref:LuxR family transcriptional regulator n=1 Tax=Kitasatospora brasiliensis TaxID=3058040 RepID=UPI00292FEDBA|nr:LuxR family transcriptional regulator [Kitasatospora sp. K002]